MIAPVDYSGRESGRLTAVKPLRSSPRGRVWLFTCSCGKPYEQVATVVFSQPITSCGCKRTEQALKNWRDGKCQLNRSGNMSERWRTQLHLPNGKFAPKGYVSRRVFKLKG